MTFTPTSPTIGETLSGSIDGNIYNYTITSTITVAEAVTAFAPIIDADSAVTCTDQTTHVECTADTAGTAFTFGANVVDITAPIISEVTPVTPSFTNDNTPDYTFTTSEAGTIGFAGGCTSMTTSASSGSNMITFSMLTDGTYDCAITVTDSENNVSNTLTGTTFTVDATAPTVTIGATPTSVNSGATSDITFTLSESSIDFGSGDVTVA